MKRNNSACGKSGSEVRALQKSQPQRSRVSRNPFANAVKLIDGKESSSRIVLRIRVEWHVVQPGICVWVRIRKRPTVVAAVSNSNELIGRVVVDVILEHLSECS